MKDFVYKSFRYENKRKHKKQKNTMVWLLIIMTIGAFLQTLGVSLLVEVVQVVVDPEKAMNSRTVSTVYKIFGFEDFKTFSILSGETYSP